MKKLFIYYSLTGNGNIVAKEFKKRNYDIREIKVKKSLPKPFFLRMMVGGFKALIKKKEKLINFNEKVDSYAEIVIGSPIWFDRLCSPVMTALRKLNLDDKKVRFVLYSGSGKGDHADEYIKANYKAEVIHLQEPRKNEEELKKL